MRSGAVEQSLQADLSAHPSVSIRTIPTFFAEAPPGFSFTRVIQASLRSDVHGNITRGDLDQVLETAQLDADRSVWDSG